MSTKLLPIRDIAAKLQLPENYVEVLGPHGAKLSLDLLTDPAFPRRGKLILVTATTPTVSGEGKTVTAIGLVQALERLGQPALITSREPSLGPVFGMKGGATGGGASQIEPSSRINLHFHGDFHAITSAHNLLAALLDAHLFHGNALDIDPERIFWPRTLDMNDRALRNIVVSVGSMKPGANRHTGFVITAASEVMAILALAAGRDDLRRRLGNIVVATTREGRPVRASDLDVVGAMMALLDDALRPNLVQTTEGTPALVHAGPFGNIAHGTSSVISQRMALQLADLVVNEAGFAADLGAEKYLDIVMQSSDLRPSIAVLVTTVQSLRAQGEGDLERGFANLEHHIAILRRFRLPIVVALNRFPADTDADLARITADCDTQGLPSAVAESFTQGGAGALELGKRVIETLAKTGDTTAPESVYTLKDSLEDKAAKVAVEIYGAEGVRFSDEARRKLDQFTAWGFANLPICIAKTQYSLSDNPRLLGAPTGWTLQITDASLSAGAGFVVLIAGNMMLMPGLPRHSRAAEIDVDAQGEIIGV